MPHMPGDHAIAALAGVYPLLQAATDHDDALVQTVQRYAWLLLAATVVGMVVRRYNIPYSVALVIGGLVINSSHVGGVPHLDPDVLLFIFLPPLLFEAAFRIDAPHTMALLRPVIILAMPGVLVTALVVGAVLWAVLGLPLSISLLFGGAVAATDPIAVVAIFRQLKVSPRLAVVAEAESLINDGMAITVYTVLLDWVITGTFHSGTSVTTFALEVVGGLGIGALTGLLSSRFTRFSDDHLIEMLLSVSVAYGSYLIADAAGASGALACVAAGFIHGSYGRWYGMSEKTADLLDDLWEFLGFVANAVVFLLLGLSVHASELVDNAWAVTVAIAAVLLSRLLVTGVTGVLAPPRDDPARTWREAVLLTWGGLRGALTAALVLALPSAVPHREQLIAMAFGVVLFTLVVQGLSLPAMIRKLGLGRA